MKRKCCRSCPRCADCPALLLARPPRGDSSEPAILVAEVLRGRPPRPLPRSVEVALAALRPER